MNNLFDLHTLLEKEEPWPFFISRVNGVKPRFSCYFVLLLDKKGVV